MAHCINLEDSFCTTGTYTLSRRIHVVSNDKNKMQKSGMEDNFAKQMRKRGQKGQDLLRTMRREQDKKYLLDPAESAYDRLCREASEKRAKLDLKSPHHRGCYAWERNFFETNPQHLPQWHPLRVNNSYLVAIGAISVTRRNSTDSTASDATVTPGRRADCRDWESHFQMTTPNRTCRACGEAECRWGPLHDRFADMDELGNPVNRSETTKSRQGDGQAPMVSDQAPTKLCDYCNTISEAEFQWCLAGLQDDQRDRQRPKGAMSFNYQIPSTSAKHYDLVGDTRRYRDNVGCLCDARSKSNGHSEPDLPPIPLKTWITGPLASRQRDALEIIRALITSSIGNTHRRQGEYSPLIVHARVMNHRQDQVDIMTLIPKEDAGSQVLVQHLHTLLHALADAFRRDTTPRRRDDGGHTWLMKRISWICATTTSAWGTWPNPRSSAKGLDDGWLDVAADVWRAYNTICKMKREMETTPWEFGLQWEGNGIEAVDVRERRAPQPGPGEKSDKDDEEVAMGTRPRKDSAAAYKLRSMDI